MNADTYIQAERELHEEDRAKGFMQFGKLLNPYAPYELGPEKLFRMLSRRPVIPGHNPRMPDASRSASVSSTPHMDAHDFDAA